MNPSVQALNLSTSTLTSASASTSTQQQNEVTTLIPDKEKLFSDLKAFTSHHEMATALERKKLKEKEQELEKATRDISKLNTQMLDWKTRAEDLKKECEGLKKHNHDLFHKQLSTTAKNVKLEDILKEKEDKISHLEQEVEKLSEKVELAQRILRSPIQNVRITNQNNETHFAICGPLNEGTGAENGAGKLESSISKQQSSTISRGVNTA